MKTKYLVLNFALSGLFFAGCNTAADELSVGGDIEITETLPQGTFAKNVTNLRATDAWEHGITIEWDEVEDDNLAGYWIEWKSTATGATYSATIKGEPYLDIVSLYNDTYKITVKCVSKDLLYSTGVSINATPVVDKTAPGAVTNLQVETFETLMVLTWKNPNDTDNDFEKLHLNVKNASGNVVHDDIVLSTDVNSYMVVNLTPSTSYTFSLTTEDYVGNVSAPVSVTETTLKSIDPNLYDEVPLNKQATPWTIADFSTEEASGEGATGRAADAIDYSADPDNEAGTFWHSRWTSGGSSLPQYITFDVGKTILPKTLTSWKRKGNGTGPREVKIEGSTDKTKFYDFGTFEITATSDEGQKMTLKNVREVRYIRFTVLKAGATGTGGYAMVRNIEMTVWVPK
ncbi:hypothetical protein AGMMS4957_02150 [Bacteroidia bacterium]|nr:hypothetical protein AGMMS4957_02150 [Bacteroidia bacterium]